MWVKKLWERCLGEWARPRPQASGRRNACIGLEVLEDRTVPSSFTAASVSDLIADINAANLAGGSNTITLAARNNFSARNTFSLTAVDNSTLGPTALPLIAANDNLTILGNGDTIERSTATGTPAFRLFAVASGAALTLQNLTVQGGLENTGWGGGGIFAQGSLTLTGVTVQNNIAEGPDFGGDGIGGGIYVSGGTASLTLTGVTVQYNAADGSIRGGDGIGGGIYLSGGTASLSNCTVSLNSAEGTGYQGSLSGIGPGNDGLGGGIYVSSGTLSLSNCTISSNTAQWQTGKKGGGPFGVFGPPGQGIGGALYIDSGTVTLLGCTVERNTTVDYGDSLYHYGVIEIYSSSVCMDAFTVAHVIRNTPNFIDGAYTIC
jgi:hypothetical protein